MKSRVNSYSQHLLICFNKAQPFRYLLQGSFKIMQVLVELPLKTCAKDIVMTCLTLQYGRRNPMQEYPAVGRIYHPLILLPRKPSLFIGWALWRENMMQGAILLAPGQTSFGFSNH